MRCIECAAETAEAAQLCTRCGVPAVRHPSVAADDSAGGGSGDSAATAPVRDAGSGPARVRRRYFLMFLACLLILACCVLTAGVLLAVSPPSASALANRIGGITGGTIVASLCGAIIFLVAFVKTLSLRRRRRFRQVAWALVPIVSFSVLAWWPFLVLALIRLRARDWAVFAAYLTALAAETAFLILGTQGVIPAGGGAIIFLWMVLLVAVTAAVHTLVAFRPGVELPSFLAADQARAAARRQQPVLATAGGEPGTLPAGSFARSAMIFVTVASCGIAIALPSRFHWAHLPVRAVEAYLAVAAAALIWGCLRSWRMTLQMNDYGVTVRNFFRTRRIDLAAFNWEHQEGTLTA